MTFSPRIQRPLFPYQAQGAQWLLDRARETQNCILGDAMGLGKSCQTLAALCTHLNDTSDRALLIAPLSVVSEWALECTAVCPTLPVALYTGDADTRTAFRNQPPPFQLLITTPELVTRDVAFFTTYHYKALVVDEGHRLKNPESILHQTLLDLPAEWRVILTGTPFPGNNYGEVYGLLHWLEPDTFPTEGQKAFAETYAGLSHATPDTETLANTFQALLRPYLLRRTTDEVRGAALPPKTETVVFCGMSDIQKSLYKSVLLKDVGALRNPGPSLRNVLGALRNCCNHPYLFEGLEPEPFEEGEHLVQAAGKLFVLDALLARLAIHGRRVLVFSTSVRTLDILQDYLTLRGHSYERLDGSVRGSERSLTLDRFRAGETFVFLLSTRAGGLGLNLTQADTVIFYDSDWNPQADLQAQARAYRIGQTKPVRVIRLISANTIEEIIEKRGRAKLRLAEHVMARGIFQPAHDGDDHNEAHAATLADTAPTSAQGIRQVLEFGLDKVWDSVLTTLSEEDADALLGSGGAAATMPGCAVVVSSKAAVQQREEAVPEADIYWDAAVEDVDTTAGAAALAALLDEADREAVVAVDARGRPRRTRSRVQRTGYDDDDDDDEELDVAQQDAKTKERKAKAKARKAARMQKALDKKHAWWKEKGYVSAALPAPEALDDNVPRPPVELRMLKGDATRPRRPPTGDHGQVILNCVDDGGNWGRGGLFGALDRLSLDIGAAYYRAGFFDDLSLGDVHVVESGSVWVAHLVVFRRKGGRLQPLSLEALRNALCRLVGWARARQLSVHSPRLGAGTPKFRGWYGVERLLRRYVVEQGVDVSVYYFSRKRGRDAASPAVRPAPGLLAP